MRCLCALGAGFLVENLIEGRKRMTTASFCIVWVIFIVNFLWEFFIKSELPPALAPLLPGLLVVFILGIILASFEFIASFMQREGPTEPKAGLYQCSSALRPQANPLNKPTSPPPPHVRWIAPPS